MGLFINNPVHEKNLIIPNFSTRSSNQLLLPLRHEQSHFVPFYKHLL